MKDQKTEWIEKAMTSMAAKKLVSPPDELYSRILSGVHGEARVLPLRKVRMGVAAASLLIVANLSMAYLYPSSIQVSSSDLVVETETVDYYQLNDYSYD